MRVSWQGEERTEVDGKEKKRKEIESEGESKDFFFADSEASFERSEGGKNESLRCFISRKKKRKNDGRDDGAPFACSIRPGIDTQERNTVSVPLSSCESRQ